MLFLTRRHITADSTSFADRSHVNLLRHRSQSPCHVLQVQAVIKNRGHDKGTWYAMKTLTKSVILERNHVSMVMKERNLLSRLHCPQLVNMHYAFQDAKNLYIIMDVCLGGDLHYQLTHSPSRCFAEEQAKFYVASIILCLDYMHSESPV